MKTTPTLPDIEEQLDKLVVSLIADGTKTWNPPTYEQVRQSILSLIKDQTNRAVEAKTLEAVLQQTKCGKPISKRRIELTIKTLNRELKDE